MSEIVNIPDENFRKWILNILNKPAYYQITKEDCQSLDYIDCSFSKIKSLKGIEYFINLKHLYCSVNQLTSLDVSKNNKLTYIGYDSNKITNLDFSNNLELNSLHFSNIKFKNLDLSKLNKLDMLRVFYNDMKKIKLNNNIISTSYFKSIITNFNNLTIQI